MDSTLLAVLVMLLCNLHETKSCWWCNSAISGYCNRWVTTNVVCINGGCTGIPGPYPNPPEYERKRRDVDVAHVNQECKCSHAVQLSRYSISALHHMDGHRYQLAIERFFDPNGVPVYDILKFSPWTGTSDVASQNFTLTTITNDCDCTSVLKPGNITIYGQEKNGQLVHGAMTNSEFYNDYIYNKRLIGGLVGGLVVAIVAVVVAAVILVKRRRNLRRQKEDAPGVGGVDNGACDVKTVCK